MKMRLITDYFHRLDLSKETRTDRGLLKLPAELILQVVGSLSPESAAALSLSCRCLYRMLKERSIDGFRKWRNSPKVWYSFLLLLERDLPDHVACIFCRRLHFIASKDDAEEIAPDPRFINSFNPKMLYYLHEEDQDYSAWHFTYVVFRTAMNRYRQNRAYQDYLDLLSSKKLKVFKEPRSPSIIGWNCSLARIHENRMLIRHQTIYLPVPLATRLELSNQILDRNICPHMEIEDLGSNEIGPWIQFDRGLDHPCIISKERIMRCPYCTTEFRLDDQKLYKNRTAMFCTIWEDLGDGLSELDPRWQRYLEEDPTPDRMNFEVGSICFAFEQGHFDFSSVITQTEKADLILVDEILRVKNNDKREKLLLILLGHVLTCKHRCVWCKDAWKLITSKA